MTQLLTSLDFLTVGQTFPPKSQQDRLNKYRENKALYKKTRIVDESTYNHMIQVIGKRFRVVPYSLMLNFYRKVSYKTADLLFTERPTYSGGGDAQKTDTIGEIVENSNLGDIGVQNAIDVSRYGDSILLLKQKEVDGKAKGVATISQPAFWYPVVSPKDLKEITHHVLAWKLDNGKKDKDKKTTIYDLYIQVHEKGKKTVYTATVKQGKIASVQPESEWEEEETGFDDFAVVPVQGVVTSDTIFSDDDYTDIKDIVNELEVRLAQIAKVLDKHADPALSGPRSALTLNEDTGEWTLDLSNYFARDNKDDPPVEYVTWEGQLIASFKEIEVLMNLLAIISEMGSAIFDDELRKGGNISGRALRFMYINALTKVARTRNSFDRAYKHAIALCSQVGYGSVVEEKDIQIQWNDGLPDDPVELAEIAKMRLNGASNDTIVAQIMAQDKVTKEQAEDKLDEMLAEKVGSQFPAFGGDNSTGANKDEGDEE